MSPVLYSEGEFDDGVVTLSAESVTLVPGFPREVHRCADSGALTHITKLRIDRGLSFANAGMQLAGARAAAAVARRELTKVGAWLLHSVHCLISIKSDSTVCV